MTSTRIEEIRQRAEAATRGVDERLTTESLQRNLAWHKERIASKPHYRDIFGKPEACIDCNYMVALLEETLRLRTGLANILAANEEFEKTMPGAWEGDPLNDACKAGRAILSRTGDETP